MTAWSRLFLVLSYNTKVCFPPILPPTFLLLFLFSVMPWCQPANGLNCSQFSNQKPMRFALMDSLFFLNATDSIQITWLQNIYISIAHTYDLKWLNAMPKWMELIDLSSLTESKRVSYNYYYNYYYYFPLKQFYWNKFVIRRRSNLIF